MYMSEELQKKWAPVLEHAELDAIKDPYKKAVTALVLENQHAAMTKDRQALMETTDVGPTNVTGSGISNFDPILISLVRRSLPNLIAYDVAGVQPMTGPTGLIFAMRARYAAQSGSEAFYNEANTMFSGVGSAANPYGFTGTTATDTSTATQVNASGSANTTTGIAMPTSVAEFLGSDSNSAFQQMAFSIEKVTVTAQSRALKAEYSLELAQDLKAIHGRWSVERFKGLIFQIERDANVIAKQTRRGKGNVLIVSSDVASAMAMAGVLSYTPALQADLQVDDTGNTFAGMLHGRIKVYIDPYYGGYTSNQELVTVGYKGSSPYDAGLFYCPYVPLQMVRAVDQYTFQPKIGFKTRYGMVANPFAEGLTAGNGRLDSQSNVYYRLFAVKNLM